MSEHLSRPEPSPASGTAAQQMVDRLDAYTQDEHAAYLSAARDRIEARRQARHLRARAAAERLRAF